MNIEKEHIYEVEIKAGDLSEYRVLKPYVSQFFFEEIAESHLERLHLNVDTIMKYRVSWVLISVSIEFLKPVDSCGKLYATTWYSQRKGPYFRRELVFRDESGEIVFQGSTFSILMDLETRTVYREKELPFELNEPLEEFTIQARPTMKSREEYQFLEERKVYPSYLDCIGHVNNCRYGEFAYDALTDNERKLISSLKRMELYFQAELSLKEQFTVFRTEKENQTLVRGSRKDGKTSFDAVFVWNK